jgi:hypothetical protein
MCFAEASMKRIDLVGQLVKETRLSKLKSLKAVEISGWYLMQAFGIAGAFTYNSTDPRPPPPPIGPDEWIQLLIVNLGIPTKVAVSVTLIVGRATLGSAVGGSVYQAGSLAKKQAKKRK